VQLFKGIDRVGRAGPDEFDVRHGKPFVAGDRSPAQLQAVLRAGLVVDRLMRRYAGGDQHDSVEAELKVRLLRAHQVTKMWRVEGPAHDSDSHVSTK
jgi:hypothetical protein